MKLVIVSGWALVWSERLEDGKRFIVEEEKSRITTKKRRNFQEPSRCCASRVAIKVLLHGSGLGRMGKSEMSCHG